MVHSLALEATLHSLALAATHQSPALARIGPAPIFDVHATIPGLGSM